MSIAYTIAGFSVGAIVGLTGVGGGSLMTPLLVLLFGINPSVAVGTDLLYAAITKAGGTLARASSQHHLTVLEYWALDYAGHRERETIAERLRELDAFVAGYLSAETDTTLVITSDHGNAEEPWHHQHSRNPVPLIVAGPAASTVPLELDSLTGVAPWLRSVLASAQQRAPGTR